MIYGQFPLGVGCDNIYGIFCSMVEEALRRLQSQHVSLQVHIITRHGELWFQEYPHSDIPYQELQGTAWVQELEGMVQDNKALHGGLLWRVIRVTNNECNTGSESVFLFHLHHVICDGISVCNLLLQFRDILNNVSTNTNSKNDNLTTAITKHDHDDKPYNTLLPPMDHFLANQQRSLSPKEKIGFYFTKYTPTFLKKSILHAQLEYFSNSQEVRDKMEIYKMFQQNVVKDEPWKTGIIPLQLTEEETRAVINACKENKVTGTHIRPARLFFAIFFWRFWYIGPTDLKNQ